MRPRLLPALLLALAMGLLAACGRTPAPTPTPALLTLALSPESKVLIGGLVRAFQIEHPSVIVQVEEQGAVETVEEVRGGGAMLGTLAVPITAEGTGDLDALWNAPLGVEGIAVIVHADNPIRNLTLAQLNDVYAGRIWHWSDLGAAAAEDEIAPLTQAPGSSSRAVFEAMVMAQGSVPSLDCPAILLYGGEGCTIEAPTSFAVVAHGAKDVLSFVAAHPGAIGYLSAGTLAALEGSQGAAGVRAVAIEDTLPEPEAALDGSYRPSRPVYLIAAGEPKGAARAFVDFCLSREGQAIVAQGYAPARAPH